MSPLAPCRCPHSVAGEAPTNGLRAKPSLSLLSSEPGQTQGLIREAIKIGWAALWGQVHAPELVTQRRAPPHLHHRQAPIPPEEQESPV